MNFLNDKQKELLILFAKFVKEHEGIKHVPTIHIESDRKNIETTANYNYTLPNKVIRIYGKGRALVDIMRSIAHELVHHRQWEQGKLNERPPDIGGEIEDEANAVAGQLIKKFAKNNKEIYD